MTDDSKKILDEQLQARFKELPKVVQNAITSADVQKQLRELADTKNLHLDQWQLLENNVMLSLLGFQPVDQLAANLKEDLGISDDVANSLTADVSRIVFEPIRQELERQLEHPEAKEKELTGVETARESILASKPVAGSPEPVANAEAATSYKLQATSSVVPAATPGPPPLTTKPIPPGTPPPPLPTERAVRAPTSSVYKTGESSTARKNVHEDPYREPPQ